MSDKQLEEIAISVTMIETELKRDREETRRMLKNHDRILFGDGSDDNVGLKTKTDRLLQKDEQRTWQMRTMWGAMVTAIIGSVASFFRPH